MEWHQGKPMRKSGPKEIVRQKVFVTHLENNSKIYIHLRNVETRNSNLSYVKLLNHDEAKKVSRILRGFALIISVEQFESIMAIFNEPKLVTEYLENQNLLLKKNHSFPRERI